MTYSIGPITLRYLTDHNWSSGRSNTDVNIIGNPQSGFSFGEQLSSFTLIGEFNADTATEARIERQKINELFYNPSISYIYIEFENEQYELSGWYTMESIDTEIEAAIFDTYKFTISVKRVWAGGSGIAMTWKSYPYNHVFANSAQLWVALPMERGPFNSQLRQTSDGLIPIFNGTDIFVNSVPLQYRANMSTFNPLGSSNYYTNRCRIYDTTTQTDVTTLDANPSETTWVERFGTHITFAGDAVFDNGVIRYIWSEQTVSNRGIVYLWTAGNWEQISLGPALFFDASPLSGISSHKPVVTYFDFNKIEWYEIITADEKRAAVIHYKMLRGSHFITVRAKADYGLLDDGSNISASSAVSLLSSDENVTSSNYRAVIVTTSLGNNAKYGMAYVNGGSLANSSTLVRFGKNTPVGEWFTFGHFVLIDPPNSSDVNSSILSRQFLANMDFNERLINYEAFV